MGIALIAAAMFVGSRMTTPLPDWLDDDTLLATHWMEQAEAFIRQQHAELERAERQIEAIWTLHTARKALMPGYCFGCDREWPCPTIQALNDAATERGKGS